MLEGIRIEKPGLQSDILKDFDKNIWMLSAG